MNNKKIVIFGNGKTGNIAYYEMPLDFEVIYFIDNGVEGEVINECNRKYVYNPNYIIKNRDWDYIYISSIKHLVEMCKQLEEMGLRYGKDYLTPYDIIQEKNEIRLEIFYRLPSFPVIDLIKKISNGRKLCILFGNCQTDMLSRLLQSAQGFRENYFIISLPPIYSNFCRDVVSYAIEIGTFKMCDLFITQYIKEDNRFFKELSTDYLCSKLDKHTRIVRIPNFFMKGYFPDAYDLKPDERVLTQYYGSTGWVSNGYRTIDRLFSKGFETERIIKKISSPDLYNKDRLLSDIYTEMVDFSNREKEQKLDLSMTDYLEKNFQKELLFYCFRHPSMSVYYELLKRLLVLLGLSCDLCVDENLSIYTLNYSMLLYPSVISGLGLSDEYNYMQYYPTSNMEGCVSFEGYVHRYCRYLASCNEGKIRERKS